MLGLEQWQGGDILVDLSEERVNKVGFYLKRIFLPSFISHSVVFMAVRQVTYLYGQSIAGHIFGCAGG